MNDRENLTAETEMKSENEMRVNTLKHTLRDSEGQCMAIARVESKMLGDREILTGCILQNSEGKELDLFARLKLDRTIVVVTNPDEQEPYAATMLPDKSSDEPNSVIFSALLDHPIRVATFIHEAMHVQQFAAQEFSPHVALSLPPDMTEWHPNTNYPTDWLVGLNLIQRGIEHGIVTLVDIQRVTKLIDLAKAYQTQEIAQQTNTAQRYALQNKYYALRDSLETATDETRTILATTCDNLKGQIEALEEKLPAQETALEDVRNRFNESYASSAATLQQALMQPRMILERDADRGTLALLRDIREEGFDITRPYEQSTVSELEENRLRALAKKSGVTVDCLNSKPDVALYLHAGLKTYGATSAQLRKAK